MVLSCLYGVKLVFQKKKGSKFCSVLCLCGGNLVSLISKKKRDKKETKKERIKEKKRQQACSFSRL